jgi:multidrug resistance efflux pump
MLARNWRGLATTGKRPCAGDRVEQAQARLEAREKAATSSQLEASRDDDGAQRVHPELDRAQKIYDRQKVPFEAGAMPRPSYEGGTRELENAAQQWAAVNKAARATTDRIQNVLKERESAKKIGDASQQLATAAALQPAVVVAPVARVVVGRKGEADQPEHEPVDELLESLRTHLISRFRLNQLRKC